MADNAALENYFGCLYQRCDCLYRPRPFFFDEYYRHLGLIPNLGRGLLWFVFCLPLIGKTVALIVSLFFLATLVFARR